MLEDAADLLIAISKAPDQTLDPTRYKHFSEKTIELMILFGYIEEVKTRPRKVRLTDLGEEWIEEQKKQWTGSGPTMPASRSR